MLFLTVPTAGNRTDLLTALIAASGLPHAQVVVVATREQVSVPEGVVLEHDLGPPNIQRWWNLGISTAERLGATAVAVLNDDIRIASGTLQTLHAALTASGAAVASPSRPRQRSGLHRGLTVPYAPRLWGSLWVLDLACALRPDERYIWWHGDDDLDIRARRDFGGVVTVDVRYKHLFPGKGTGASEELLRLTAEDAKTFEADYGPLLRPPRRVSRLASLFRR